MKLADKVLSLLSDVQRLWSHLQSIFSGPGSEDIKRQLPEDYDRFLRTNDKFQQLIMHLLDVPNAITIATRPGILKDLRFIEDELQLCEKALSNYLDSKRVSFPRFYFIATCDLIDILSNGNDPAYIQR